MLYPLSYGGEGAILNPKVIPGSDPTEGKPAIPQRLRSQETVKVMGKPNTRLRIKV